MTTDLLETQYIVLYAKMQAAAEAADKRYEEASANSDQRKARLQEYLTLATKLQGAEMAMALNYDVKEIAKKARQLRYDLR